MQGLADALGIGLQQAQWWHALFVLEHTLGRMSISRQGTAGKAAAVQAALELCLCQDANIILYATQLMIALGETISAERLIQKCCHGTMKPEDHCLSVRQPVYFKSVQKFDSDDVGRNSARDSRSAHTSLFGVARGVQTDLGCPVECALL
jgi:hypothetical protein